LELTGVGPKRAAQIISERSNGEFTSASDLSRVGLGSKAIMKLTTSRLENAGENDENETPNRRTRSAR